MGAWPATSDFAGAERGPSPHPRRCSTPVRPQTRTPSKINFRSVLRDVIGDVVRVCEAAPGRVTQHSPSAALEDRVAGEVLTSLATAGNKMVDAIALDVDSSGRVVQAEVEFEAVHARLQFDHHHARLQGVLELGLSAGVQQSGGRGYAWAPTTCGRQAPLRHPRVECRPRRARLEAQGVAHRGDVAARHGNPVVVSPGGAEDEAVLHRCYVPDAADVDEVAAVDAQEAEICQLSLDLLDAA